MVLPILLRSSSSSSPVSIPSFCFQFSECCYHFDEPVRAATLTHQNSYQDSETNILRKMGCISSKVVSRSMSWREQLDHSTRRQGSTLSPPEESSVSENINYQILALVRSASTAARKLGSRRFSTKRSSLDVEPEGTIVDDDKREAILILERSGDQAKNAEPEEPMLLLLPGTSNSTDGIKRSTSSRGFPQKEVDAPDAESLAVADGNEDDAERVRSFHTVEEYDALLEKLKLSMPQSTSSDAMDDGITTKEQLQQSSQSQPYASSHISNGHSGLEEADKLELQAAFLVDDCVTEDTTSTSAMEGAEHVDIGNKFDMACTLEEPIIEKTFKRKSMTKDLESIEIPKNIEFTAVASLREWLQGGGHVYSPGAYITPKFGSYSVGKSGTESNESNEDAIFNPELVAACEECMHQLEEEAEGILKQMAQDLEDESAIN